MAGGFPYAGQLIGHETGHDHDEQRQRPGGDRLTSIRARIRRSQQQLHLPVGISLDAIATDQTIFARVQLRGIQQRRTYPGIGSATARRRSHGNHPAATVRTQQQIDRTEPATKCAVPKKQSDHQCHRQRDPKKHRRVMRHAMNLHSRHEQLQQREEHDDKTAPDQPAAQRALRQPQLAAEFLRPARHPFERTDHAPNAPQPKRHPHHRRPPQSPDDEVHKVGLRIELGVDTGGRVVAPSEHRQRDIHAQRGALKHSRKTFPTNERGNSSDSQQVEVGSHNDALTSSPHAPPGQEPSGMPPSCHRHRIHLGPGKQRLPAKTGSDNLRLVAHP